jgi:hypothetical protein
VQRPIEEDEEVSDYDSFDEGEFEMVSNRRPGTSTTGSGSTRGSSRRPGLRTVRIKVHGEDVRLVTVGAAIEFPDLVDKIRDKFGLRQRFKLKVRDEDAPQSDMITVGDQDDLEMIMSSVKAAARKKREETGKLDVSSILFYIIRWHKPLSFLSNKFILTDFNSADLDSGDIDISPTHWDGDCGGDDFYYSYYYKTNNDTHGIANFGFIRCNDRGNPLS